MSTKSTSKKELLSPRLTQLLVDVAVCLDDCLTLMMPEEHSMKKVFAAKDRMIEAGGRVSKISHLLDQIKIELYSGDFSKEQ